VNNRDLRTFQVSLDVSKSLAPAIPDNAIKVSESGIFSFDDIDTLRAAGFEAFLIGEHLVKSSDPTAALQALTA
jgi:indole-3-glycerol phosphate synthase